MEQNGIVLPRRAVKIITWLLVIAIMISLFVVPFTYRCNYKKYERLSETSPDGKYNVNIYSIGEPPFKGADTIKIIMSRSNESSDLCSDTFTITALCDNDGCRAYCRIEWFDDRAAVTVHGKHQSEAVYILPYVNITENMFS